MKQKLIESTSQAVNITRIANTDQKLQPRKVKHIHSSIVTIAIEDNDAWSLFKILKDYIPGKQITIDDNNTWNLLKITWRAIAAADLLTTAASCCSFVVAAKKK